MAILSLTSIPPRFSDLAPVLHSIAQQDAPVGEIRLYLPRRYRRFPDYDGAIPEVPKNVRIIRVNDDLGPASKVLHAVEELKGETTPILFCDDDHIYPQGWAMGLLEQHVSRRNACTALFGCTLKEIGVAPTRPAVTPAAKFRNRWLDFDYRKARLRQQLARFPSRTKAPRPPRRPVKKAGYIDLFYGYCGAVITSNVFDSEVFDIPEALWMVDDIWLSGHLARLGLQIWLPDAQMQPSPHVSNDLAALKTSVFQGQNRHASNVSAVRYFQNTYGIWG